MIGPKQPRSFDYDAGMIQAAMIKKEVESPWSLSEFATLRRIFAKSIEAGIRCFAKGLTSSPRPKWS